MQRDITKLAEEYHDVLIVGGGIFAACAAWDAALRGLKVALIEKDDFCSGTSANSLKMVHGGIRYLQHADLVRLRSSCRERSALLRIAPHLVQPLPILIPTYGYGKSGKLFLGTGMLLYDLLTLGRNRGIRDPAGRIPWSRFFDKREVLREYPDLDSRDLTGGAVFCDGQMYNPTRLVLAFIQSACEKGAGVANYVEAKKLLREGNRIVGVGAVDHVSNQQLNIKAGLVLNAAGPWSEWLLEASLERKRPDRIVYSRDACFVVKRRFPSRYAIAVQGRTRDPDALLSRPARHLFMAPWRGYTLIGVWHVVWKKHPEQVTVTEDEIRTFIDEINWAYPGLGISTKDVLMWNAGLVPFGENEPGARDLSYGKRSHLIDHKVSEGLEGLVTLVGVRYTTARGDAAKAVDMVCAKLEACRSRPATESIPLSGGDFEDFETLVREIQQQSPGLQQDCVRALAHNYGTCAARIAAMASRDSSLAGTIGDTGVTRAEIVHAVESEMAYDLADVVFRRTDMATGGNPGMESLQECANIMAGIWGWSEQETQAQIDRVMKRFPDWV
jgi:glycerol-3-phosphate dehydrogenase